MTVTELLKQASEIKTKDPRAVGEEMESLARSFAPYGDDTLPELIEAAQHTNSLIAQTARIALNLMHSQATRQAMADLLAMKDNHLLKQLAQNWLGNHPSQESVDILINHYNSIAELMEKEDIVRVLRKLAAEYPAAQKIVVDYANNPPDVDF